MTAPIPPAHQKIQAAAQLLSSWKPELLTDQIITQIGVITFVEVRDLYKQTFSCFSPLELHEFTAKAVLIGPCTVAVQNSNLENVGDWIHRIQKLWKKAFSEILLKEAPPVSIEQLLQDGTEQIFSWISNKISPSEDEILRLGSDLYDSLQTCMRNCKNGSKRSAKGLLQSIIPACFGKPLSKELQSFRVELTATIKLIWAQKLFRAPSSPLSSYPPF